jgi:nephrocystin-3
MSHYPPLTADREIRVFVSSTFRDMQEDRDWLVKHIFPQLRRLCEARGVTWGEVDLRWGITDEEAAEGKVLPLCLAEIERSRPYFIGLLGERYGWVPKPEEIPEELLEREAWLRDHLQCSVTELEIIHGVLREERMHGHAFFYSRDPDYLDRLPPNRIRGDFESESPEAKEKIERLKNRLRDARDEQVCQFHENYPDPQELGNWILEDFTQLIERRFPADAKPDELDREAAGHDAFARSRAAVYIGRPEYFDRLDAHVAGDGPPLVVLGESGSGKSALLANWFLSRFRSSASNVEPSAALALIHFIGSTPDSADASRLMQRMMLELKRRFDLPDDVPSMPDQIRDQFPNWLNKTAGAGRIVLVLDALNQLADQDHAPDLGWLPRVLPMNVRLIVSTLPGRSLDAVQRRDWPEMTVELLSVSERQELIEKFLARSSRRLSRERVDRIAGAAQTANPLFLSAMLDELRQFGEYERLDEMIEHYLAAANPQDLYQRILARWEQDYDRERPGLVRDALSLIGSARRGLSESELLDLLGTGGQPLPRAAWTPFYLAAEASLARRSGLLGFFHDYLRNAVQTHCLPTIEQRRACHRTLADYFRDRPEMTDRELDELPWQWQQAEEWTQLKDLVTRMEVFRRLRSAERWKQDLQAYWLALKPHYDPCDAYRQALDQWENEAVQTQSFCVAVNRLGAFHYERAEHAAAEPLYRRALAIDEQSYGAEHPRVATHLNNLAQSLQDTNRLAEAEPLIRRALAIDEQSYGAEHPNVAIRLNNLAGLLQATNRLAEAEPLMRRTLAFSEASYGCDHPNVAIRLNNLAGLLQATNRLAEAEPLCRRALAIDEQSYGAEHPRVATHLNSLAQLLQATNRLAEAEPLMRRALSIDEQSYGAEHPRVATHLNNLAALLQATNRLAEAEPLMRRALVIDEKSYGAEHPKVAIRLNNLAQLLQATNGSVAEGHEPSGGGRAADAPRAGHRRAVLRDRAPQHRHSTSTTWRSCSRPRTGWRRPSR